MEIQYRVAEECDVNAVCDLVTCAVTNMENQNIFQWDSIYPTREDFLEDIKKQELFVGLLEDKIVVIYTLNEECEKEYQNGDWKYVNSEFRVIHRLCVHPQYQNMGIARNTLMHIETQLKQKHVDSIRLDVFSNNPFALRLYTSNGYKKVGYADWRIGRFYLMEKEIKI